MTTRTGLVLGAGGVLGAAWTIGALAALEQERGLDPREAEVPTTTSASRASHPTVSSTAARTPA